MTHYRLDLFLYYTFFFCFCLLVSLTPSFQRASQNPTKMDEFSLPRMQFSDCDCFWVIGLCCFTIFSYLPSTSKPCGSTSRECILFCAASGVLCVWSRTRRTCMCFGRVGGGLKKQNHWLVFSLFRAFPSVSTDSCFTFNNTMATNAGPRCTYHPASGNFRKSPFPTRWAIAGELCVCVCVCLCMRMFRMCVAVCACIFVTFALCYKSEEALVWVLAVRLRLSVTHCFS